MFATAKKLNAQCTRTRTHWWWWVAISIHSLQPNCIFRNMLMSNLTIKFNLSKIFSELMVNRACMCVSHKHHLYLFIIWCRPLVIAPRCADFVCKLSFIRTQNTFTRTTFLWRVKKNKISMSFNQSSLICWKWCHLGIYVQCVHEWQMSHHSIGRTQNN